MVSSYLRGSRTCILEKISARLVHTGNRLPLPETGYMVPHGRTVRGSRFYIVVELSAKRDCLEI